jgi:hypothetical protein
LLAIPFTVTTTVPATALFGTVVATVVLLQLVTAAATPLKVTVLEPCAVPKFVPVIVTNDPAKPGLGDSPVRPGVKVKFTPLLATPLTLTATGPVLVLLGIVAVMLVLLQLATEADTPLKVIALVP